VADGDLRISTVAAHPKIDTPVIPELLHSDWQNINTPEQLRSVAARKRNAKTIPYGKSGIKVNDCS
jgi:molybdopterin-guanine dinucleotide biosynthesis protein A